MRRLILIIAMCAGGLWGGPAGADVADDAVFDRAWAAYDRGDYADALNGFRILAEKGYANAQFNLGVVYDKGKVIPRDYAEAVKWYRMAAERGLVDA